MSAPRDLDREAPREVLLALCERLAAMPARFHLAAGRPPGHVTFEELGEPATMSDQLDRFAERRGIGDHQIAASLYIQGLAMRVLGPALAAPLQEGLLLLAEPREVAIGPAGPSFTVSADSERISKVAALGDRPLIERWYAHWVDHLFGDVVASVRRVRRVGERMLVGNVASAAASNLVFLDWWNPDRGLRRYAPAMARSGRVRMDAMVNFGEIIDHGRAGLASARNSCCLALKLPDPHVCPTCPKATAEERASNLRVHLGHLQAVRSGQAVGPPQVRSAPPANLAVDATQAAP